MKYINEIVKGDILWIIDDSIQPKLIALPIIDVQIKKYPWTADYHILLKFPDGKELWVNLFDNGSNRDYDIPFLTSMSKEINNIENELHVIASFDKKALWKQYISGLKKSIETVEDVIEKGKLNLIDLNTKLNYINKQKDIIDNE